MERKTKTMDGNTAAAHVAYAYTDVSAIYPITPSSPMADCMDQWSHQERKNIFGQPVALTQMQSEAGVAGAVHGALLSGAFTTTFSASQGLLLMIPNMYKIAGELLPCVIHVSARTVATHALSIFGDHSDIYACRQTGFAMLSTCSVQEVMDLSPVAHLSAIKGRVPFLHFFDGFRTSHEIQKIKVWDYETLKEMCDMDAVDAFRNRALNPEHPVMRGTAQNPDIYFQAREACNPFYNAIPEIVESYMNEINTRIGTEYRLFNYYGASDAEHVIIAMGSVCETVMETVDYLMSQGQKVGLIKVRLYRPFSTAHLLKEIPVSCKTITVLDRTKEPGAVGDPLFLDVVAALKGSPFETVPVYAGRYGLSSKDTLPGDIAAAFHNQSKKHFTLGIIDDVTHLSLERKILPDTSPTENISCKFWGLGADGTVGANKNSVKIIGDYTNLYVQAYFDYDSKKSGGLTVSHLRFGKKPIRSAYLIHKADFVACHKPAFVRKYDMVQDLKEQGVFLLNCSWNQKELEKELPGQVKKYLYDHQIRFYTVDGFKIAKEIGLGGRINTILQAAFFALSEIIPVKDAIHLMKEAATNTYAKKGEEVVSMNHAAIEAGAHAVHQIKIPASWGECEYEPLEIEATGERSDVVNYVNQIQNKINRQIGNTLPVSAFTEYADGTLPSGSSAFEKRGIAIEVPGWNPENCIQCNFCSYVCPHAAIRPMAMNESQFQNAPESTITDLMGLPGYKFAVSISPLDCTGCGSCVNICPGKKGEKALLLKPFETQRTSQELFDYGATIETPTAVFEKFPVRTVKGSQFKQPLLEFSGACAGCAETPYAKLLTQLFGDKMYIANATGCSSIWGGSSPASPYTVNKQGRGPAWANSLFEDNAEFGYGIGLASRALRKPILDAAERLMRKSKHESIRKVIQTFLDTQNSSTENGPATRNMIAALETCDCNDEDKQYILKHKDYAAKKSHWIVGGDGWAYDIGFGGLDHVLSGNSDVNVLVFDTEVYSNTGGQSSKATPLGAIAQFAASGKESGKKDLTAIAMSYGHAYVAQVSMGADFNQCIKAFTEAESYPGPSLIVAYAPCISHGIQGGMTKAKNTEKAVVEAGYWHLFRYDPRLEHEGKNPFQLDSKEPKGDFQTFLASEVRYNSLLRSNPKRAKELFEKAEKNAKKRYEMLKKRADM
ncbi:MAG: pyruvate:ferredoxin (flavodoxin) oxidoreductase [Lachnospiraceae bacterium]|nr:pyruvate:ferredoxin (flavodoxin) oxidoreductase [Lachnospiraceae bacterium]